MITYPAYWQMPKRAIPLNAWPLGALVGLMLVIAVASSGVRRLDQARIYAADEKSMVALQDDQDFMEILTIILQAGLLD